MAVGSGNREEVVTAAKNAVAAVAAEGTGAVVLAAATVAMVMPDNISKGGADNSGRNRGSSRATTINQPKRDSSRGENGSRGSGSGSSGSGSSGGSCGGSKYNNRGRL